jgi:hypothetical protein
MSFKQNPIATPAPKILLPPPAESAEVEVVRLRAMVGVLAELLVECGVVELGMVEGRLRTAAATSAAPAGASDDEVPSLKKPGLFAQLFAKLGKPKPQARRAAAPPAPPVDETARFAKLPFDTESLYDEPDRATEQASMQARGLTPVRQVPQPPVAATNVGVCTRCWKRRPLEAGRMCADCAARA